MQLPEEYEHGSEEPVVAKPEPPDELKLLWQIERYKALPLAGGLLDQPAILMRQMNICINARDSVLAVLKSVQHTEASNGTEQQKGDPFGII